MNNFLSGRNFFSRKLTPSCLWPFTVLLYLLFLYVSALDSYAQDEAPELLYQPDEQLALDLLRHNIAISSRTLSHSINLYAWEDKKNIEGIPLGPIELDNATALEYLSQKAQQYQANKAENAQYWGPGLYAGIDPFQLSGLGNHHWMLAEIFLEAGTRYLDFRKTSGSDFLLTPTTFTYLRNNFCPELSGRYRKFSDAFYFTTTGIIALMNHPVCGRLLKHVLQEQRIAFVLFDYDYVPASLSPCYGEEGYQDAITYFLDFKFDQTNTQFYVSDLENSPTESKLKAYRRIHDIMGYTQKSAITLGEWERFGNPQPSQKIATEIRQNSLLCDSRYEEHLPLAPSSEQVENISHKTLEIIQSDLSDQEKLIKTELAKGVALKISGKIQEHDYLFASDHEAELIKQCQVFYTSKLIGKVTKFSVSLNDRPVKNYTFPLEDGGWSGALTVCQTLMQRVKDTIALLVAHQQKKQDAEALNKLAKEKIREGAPYQISGEVIDSPLEGRIPFLFAGETTQSFSLQCLNFFTKIPIGRQKTIYVATNGDEAIAISGDWWGGKEALCKAITAKLNVAIRKVELDSFMKNHNFVFDEQSKLYPFTVIGQIGDYKYNIAFKDLEDFVQSCHNYLESVGPGMVSAINGHIKSKLTTKEISTTSNHPQENICEYFRPYIEETIIEHHRQEFIAQQRRAYEVLISRVDSTYSLTGQMGDYEFYFAVESDEQFAEVCNKYIEKVQPGAVSLLTITFTSNLHEFTKNRSTLYTQEFICKSLAAHLRLGISIHQRKMIEKQLKKEFEKNKPSYSYLISGTYYLSTDQAYELHLGGQEAKQFRLACQQYIKKMQINSADRIEVEFNGSHYKSLQLKSSKENDYLKNHDFVCGEIELFAEKSIILSQKLAYIQELTIQNEAKIKKQESLSIRGEIDGFDFLFVGSTPQAVKEQCLAYAAKVQPLNEKVSFELNQSGNKLIEPILQSEKLNTSYFCDRLFEILSTQMINNRVDEFIQETAPLGVVDPIMSIAASLDPIPFKIIGDNADEIYANCNRYFYRAKFNLNKKIQTVNFKDAIGSREINFNDQDFYTNQTGPFCQELRRVTDIMFTEIKSRAVLRSRESSDDNLIRVFNDITLSGLDVNSLATPKVLTYFSGNSYAELTNSCRQTIDDLLASGVRIDSASLQIVGIKDYTLENSSWIESSALCDVFLSGSKDEINPVLVKDFVDKNYDGNKSVQITGHLAIKYSSNLSFSFSLETQQELDDTCRSFKENIHDLTDIAHISLTSVYEPDGQDLRVSQKRIKTDYGSLCKEIKFYTQRIFIIKEFGDKAQALAENGQTYIIEGLSDHIPFKLVGNDWHDIQFSCEQFFHQAFVKTGLGLKLEQISFKAGHRRKRIDEELPEDVVSICLRLSNELNITEKKSESDYLTFMKKRAHYLFDNHLVKYKAVGSMGNKKDSDDKSDHTDYILVGNNIHQVENDCRDFYQSANVIKKQDDGDEKQIKWLYYQFFTQSQSMDELKRDSSSIFNRWTSAEETCEKLKDKLEDWQDDL